MSFDQALALTLFVSGTLFCAASAAPGVDGPRWSDPVGDGEAPRAGLIGVRATDLAGTALVIGGAGERRPVALVFYDTECPISNRYLSRLADIAAVATDAGIDFFGVLSNPAVSVVEANEHRAEYDVRFPVLFDSSGDLAARLEPTNVPEAFVVSAKDELVYRGRIDDWFAAVGQPRKNVSSHDLADAIAAIVQGEDVDPARTEPIGCVFEYWDDAALQSEVTYTRDIAPILNASCVECHRAGEIAPFALTSYEDAKRRAKMLALVAEEGVMPPWRAARDHGRFKNERHLSEREVELLQRWARTGAARGDEAELLPPPDFPGQGWRLGVPDLVLSMPAEFEIPADGEDIYRNFVIPIDLEEDRLVVAAEFHPGDPTVVHHGIFYLDDSGRARALDAKDDQMGYSVFGAESPGFWPSGDVGGWSPGSQPYALPEGYGMEVDDDEDLIMELHYHPTGKATKDRSELGLYFAEGPVRAVESIVIGTQTLQIPAGESHYWRHVWMEVPLDTLVLDITPHSHYLGKEFHVDATLPSGEVVPMIRVDDYDFRWQDTYHYAEPLALPAGTRIDARVRFDNSAENPDNPSAPPIQVIEGWRTTDEMCQVYMTMVPREDGGRAARRKLMQASFASWMRDPTMVD